MEQLQQTLNEAIEMGWSYKFLKQKRLLYFKCLEEGVRNMEDYSDREDISYHDLFSKDSGLMELMEWRESESDLEYLIGGVKERRIDPLEYRYMIMGDMTSQEKIDYFNTYSYLPDEPTSIL